MNTSGLTAAYEHGRRARRDDCYRVLCCPEGGEQLAAWLRGWDDENLDIRRRTFAAPGGVDSEQPTPTPSDR